MFGIIWQKRDLRIRIVNANNNLKSIIKSITQFPVMYIIIYLRYRSE